MKLRTPSFALWLLALVCGVAGLLMRFNVLHVSGLGIDSFWFVTAGFLMLVIGPLLR